MPFGYSPIQYRGQDPNDPQLLHVVERGGPQYGIAMDQPSYASPYSNPPSNAYGESNSPYPVWGPNHQSSGNWDVIDRNMNLKHFQSVGALPQGPLEQFSQIDPFDVVTKYKLNQAAEKSVAQAAPDPLETLSTRYRPTAQYSDILAGKTRAGLESLPFLNDPQFAQLDPKSQNELVRRYSGHSLDEQQQASSIYSGQPTTWQDIQQQQYQQKRQAASLAQLRALDSITGGKLGDQMSTFDPETGQSQVTRYNSFNQAYTTDSVPTQPELVEAGRRLALQAGLPKMWKEPSAIDAGKAAKIARAKLLLKARGASEEQIAQILGQREF